ncbi:MAG: ribonuclease VapC [Phycisphaerae bacterium]
MIILDTNVISALMQTSANPTVVAWLDAQASESIWTTSVCVFEICYGLSSLPSGRRRQSLLEAFGRTLVEDLDSRVLDFDMAAAYEAGTIAARLRTTGRMVEIRDVQIAGIVAARRGILATRNIVHFAATGIPLANPWEGSPG